MKFATRSLLLVCITVVLAGCHNGTVQSTHWFPAVKNSGVNADGTVNCVALKRQRTYNQSNMNMETNTTTPAQLQALDDLIAKNCK
jgi:hypothetical protein